jgi:hypothetical protein
MKTITATQKELLRQINLYLPLNYPIEYDKLKKLANFRTFDTTFNKLFLLGYFKRIHTDNFSNQFIRVK